MSSEKEYIVFADESEKSGRFFSNFYGGLIVGASQYERITRRLEGLKDAVGFHGEVKWSKVTDQYLGRYKLLIAGFFKEIKAGNVRVRIMFTQNATSPATLGPEDRELAYFKLYYQFVKHAFGLRYVAPRPQGTLIRLYFDEFPQTREKVALFKGFLMGLAPSHEFRNARLRIHASDIAEIRSHEHVLVQCLDVVLGAMAFRLNERHRDIPAGARVRGRRTRAKEDLYKTVLSGIRELRPGFNIGISTGLDGDMRNLWAHPWRHWRFAAKESVLVESKTKGDGRKRRSRPGQPT